MSGQTFGDRDRARAQLPTKEQLLHLIDRAERHVLTPTEAHLLRVGVAHLAAQLGGAGGRIRKLTAELEQARREAADLSPLSVACPYCEAPAAARCRTVKGSLPPRTPHTARLDAARRRAFEQALDEAS